MNAILHGGKSALYRIKNNGALVGLLLLLVLASFINPSFLTLENLSNVFRQASTNGMIALGIMVVIITGQIDLSVGSIFGLSGFLALYLSNYSFVAAIVVPLLMGAAAGCCNAFLITSVGMVPWIATLSMMLCLRGVTLVSCNEATYVTDLVIPAFNFIGRGTFASYISMPALIFLACLVVVWYILNRTSIGRNLYACGGNGEAAMMMGIKVVRAKWFAYIVSGVLTALSGIVLVSRLGAAYPLSGDGGELDAIAAAVIGGTLLTGGKGRVSGTLVGVLIMALLRNIFNMQTALNTHWEKVITGILVLAVVLIQSRHANRLLAKKR